MKPRFLCLLFVASAACAKSRGPASPAENAPSPPSSAAAPQDDPLVGKPAPDFTSTAQDGTEVHIAGYKGKPVVLYFYPKDETPGCTKEACSLRDAWDAIRKTGAVLVGISADTLESHRQFAERHQLPFLLLSDPMGQIAKLYGVPFFAIHKRQTVVIGPDGRVKKVYREVDVGVHAGQILSDLGSSA